jgi:hypothetical protein
MGFQSGDGSILIDGRTYNLRLTMGALAEITSRLSVSGPQELSFHLRSLTAADGRVLLACMMRPCLPSKVNVIRLAAHLSDSDIAAAMPIICRLFEEGFSDEK